MKFLEFNRIKDAWCKETASPGTPDAGPYNPRGQCAVTALLVQDLLGGEIVRGVVFTSEETQESHYWNRIPGMGDVDITRAQYPEDITIPNGQVVDRDRLLCGERAEKFLTNIRYQLLKCRAGFCN